MPTKRSLNRAVTLPLAQPADAKGLEALVFPDGLTAAHLDATGRKISLSYDLERITLARLEPWLASVALPLSGSLFARWHRQWMAFKDDNRLDQASIVHQCCNLPPKG